MSSDREERNRSEALGHLSREAAEALWPVECRQFDEALTRARGGFCTPMALVADAGRGKTWLLGSLVQSARRDGDPALHIHLDRYFTVRALASHSAQRLIELNPELSSLATPAGPGFDSFLELLRGANEYAAASERGFVLGLSGLEASVDGAADSSVLDAASELVHMAQRQWRNSLIVVELRPQHVDPILDPISHSGLVYFPLADPADAVVARVLATGPEDLTPFAPSVAPMASARARGNLHRLVAAMRSVSSRCRAAGIDRVEPVQWEALAGASMSEQIDVGSSASRRALLAAIVDWPAAGFIPLDALLWRLQVLGVVRTDAEFDALLADLRSSLPILGLDEYGRVPHLRFEWLELRRQATRAALEHADPETVAGRRRLQGTLAAGLEAASAGDSEEALRALDSVVAGSAQPEYAVFRRQAAALAGAIWRGEYDIDLTHRAACARLLAETSGAAACADLLEGLRHDEPAMHGAAADALVYLGEDAVKSVARVLGPEDLALSARAATVLSRIPVAASLEAVVALLKAADAELVRIALEALRALMMPAAGARIVSLVEHDRPEIRADAIATLAHLSYVEGLPAVATALSDESELVRAAASACLSELGDERAIPTLIDRLCLPDSPGAEAIARALVTFGEPAHEALLEAAQSPDPASRRGAVQGLRYFPGDQAIPHLVSLLCDEHQPVARAAQEALAGFGTNAVPPVSALLSDEEPRIRRLAAGTLVLIGEGAAGALESLLLSQSAHARVEAAWALGTMAWDPATGALAGLLADAETEVRLASVEALRRIGSGDALRWLVGALSDPGAEVSAAASEAVGAFGEQALPALLAGLTDPAGRLVAGVERCLVRLGGVATRALCEALTAADTACRLAALEVLGRLSDRECLPHVARLLADPDLGRVPGDLLLSFGADAMPTLFGLLDDPALAQAASELAVEAGQTAVLPGISALADPVAEVRLGSARVLGRLRSSEAVAGLAEALSDADARVRAAAADALGSIADPGALPGLVAVTRDPEADVVRAAASALCVFGERAARLLVDSLRADDDGDLAALLNVVQFMGADALPDFRALLAEAEARVRAGAVRLLAAIPDEPSIPGLCGLLADEDERVSQAARSAVRTLGRAAVPALVALLLDESQVVRERALEPLVELGGEGLAPVVALLEDEDREVRKRGAWAAAAFGETAVADVSAVLSGSQNPGARQSAATCLARIATATAVDSLIAALTDEAESVRATVVRCLDHVADPRAVPALVTLAATPEGPDQQAAARALESFGALAVPALAQALADARPAVGQYARQALIALGEPAAEGLLHALPGAAPRHQAALIETLSTVGPALAAAQVLDLLTAENPAGQAARAFARTHHEHCMGGLVRRVASEQPGVTEAACEVLVAVGSPSVEPLTTLCAQGTDNARAVAARLLGDIGDASALPALLGMLSSPLGVLRLEAVDALLRIGDPQALDALVEAFADADPKVARAAFGALTAFGVDAAACLVARYELHTAAAPLWLHVLFETLGEPALDLFETLLIADEASARAGAFRALRALDQDRLGPLIPGLLSDPDPLVQDLLVDACRDLGALVSPDLLAALTGEPGPAQALADRCLDAVGPAAVGVLLEGLTDANLPRRSNIIALLSRIGDTAAVEPLVALLDDADEALAQAAEDAVVSFGQAAVGALLDEMESPRERLRGRVADALGRLGDVVRAALVELAATAVPHRAAAALGIVRRMGATEVLPSLVGRLADDPQISDPAAEMLLEHTRQSVGLLRGGLESDSDGIRQRCGQLLAQIGEPALEQLTAALLEDGVRARTAAAAVLVEIGSQAAVEPLALAMSDAEPVVRCASAAALGALGGVAPLVQAVGDTDPGVRECVTAGLVGLGVPALEELLLRHSTPEQAPSGPGLEVLRAFGDLAAAHLERSLLEGNADARARAVRGLGALRHTVALPAIADLLSDTDNRVRQAASDVLVAAGSDAVQPLLEALAAPRVALHDGAALCLIQIGQPAAAALLEVCLASPDSVWVEIGPDARARAISVVAEIGPDGLGEHLTPLLTDPAEQVRVAAARAVQRVGYASAVPVLLDGIDEDTPDARDARLAALCSFGQMAVPFLIERMENPAWAGSPALAAALASLGELVEDAIVTLLDDPSADRRLLAARTLHDMRLERAAPGLYRRVSDPDERVRLAAALALAQLPPIHAQPLLDDLGSAQEDTRRHAVAALALQGSDVLDAVVGKASDPNPVARSEAVRLLGITVRDADRDTVLGAMDDPDAAVRVEAIRAALQWPDDALAYRFVALLADASEQVVPVAAEALRQMGPGAHTALFEHLLTPGGDPDPVVAQVLGLPSEDALNVVRGYLDSELPGHREQAVRCLARVGVEADLDLLAGALEDPEDAVADAAASCLLEVGERAVQPVTPVFRAGTGLGIARATRLLAALYPASRVALVEMLADESADLRLRALELLCSKAEAGDAAVIAEQLVDEHEPVRITAARALAELGAEDCLPALLANLDEDSPASAAARQEAVVSLGARAVPDVARVLDQPGAHRDGRVLEIARALGAQFEAAVRALLASDAEQDRARGLRLLDLLEPADLLETSAGMAVDPAAAVRAEVVRILGRFGAGAEALLPWLAETGDAELARVAECLVALGDPAVDLARTQLDASVAEVRGGAVEVLALARREADFESLAALLEDPVAAIRARVCRVLPGFASPSVVPLLAGMMDDTEPTVSEAAATALAETGTPGVEALLGRFQPDRGQDQPALVGLRAAGVAGSEVLRALLAGPEPSVRASSARALGMVGDADAIPLLALAACDLDRGVQQAATVSLVAFGAQAVPAVYTILIGDNPDLRYSASDVLVAMGADAVERLVLGLAETSGAARAACLRTLVLIGDERALPGVSEYLSDPDEEVRAASVLAVQRFAYQPALPGLLAGILEETEALSEARQAAVCSFRAAAVPVLIDHLAGPEDPITALVIRMLAQLREVAVEAVAALLDRASPAARLVGVRALGAMRTEQAAQALAGAVTDDDRQVRHEAARLLALTGPTAGELLMGGLREVDPVRRSRVCEALALHGTEILDAVASLLTYDDMNVALAALETLGRSHRLGYVDNLAAALDDLREPVRTGACEALGLMRNPQAAEVLVDALYRDEPAVSAAAIDALGRMQDVAYELLLPRLVDDDGQVDERILSALSVGGDAAGPVLRECLSSPVAGTRAAAARGLVRVAGDQAVPDLAALLADPEAQVRQAAVDSLVSVGELSAAPALEILQSADAAGCLAAGDVLGQTGAGLVETLLEILRSAGPDARAGAARALGQIGDEQAVAHLVGRLRDPHAPVRVEAARALGLLRAVAAAPHLLGAIDDTDSDVSRAAIDALGHIGAPAADALLNRLITPEGQIRDDVVYALVGIGPSCIEPLAELARNQGAVARTAQMRVLTLIGGEEAVHPLVEGLFDESSEVRAEAMRGIQAVGRPAVGELVSRLKAGPGRVAVDRLATALARLREAALPDVVALLESPDEGLTRVAANILGQMGMVASAALRRALTHRRPNVRTLALTGIARIGDVSVVPDIIELLQDEDTGVVGAAIRALADLQDPRGIRPIAACMGSDSPEIRDALNYAVPRFGSSIAAPLADMITDPAATVRDHAARALVTLEKGALPALERKLRSEEPQMRAAAAGVMGDLAVSGVVDPLVGRLGDREPEVRQAAAEALGKIGGPAVAPTLERMREQDERVDDGILRALHAMTVDPVYTLTQYARDGDEVMRLAAVRMAGRYGRNEAVATLQQRLQDTSLTINCAAAEALASIATHDALTVLAREAVTDKPEVAQAIRAGLVRHAVDSIPILVRMATRPKGEPLVEYVAVAAEISRSAPGIVDEMLSDGSEQVRRTAAMVLGDVGSSQSLRSLVRKARDPDAPVRRAAAVALGRIGGEAVAPLAALLDDDDADVCRAAADVLASMEQQGVSVLLQRLKGGRDTALQIIICRSLGSAEIIDAAETLEGIVKKERRTSLAVAAAGALAQMGHAAGLEVLREALLSDDDAVRGEAADYLGWIGGETALALVSMVDDSDPRVRAAATRALQGLSGSDVPLLLTYAVHKEPQVRLAVATALREAPNDPDALDALLQLLQDEHEDVCQAAVDSLVVFGDAGLSRLSVQATSEDADARYAACWALSQVGAPAVDALLQGLERGSLEARADILRALGRIGDPRARGAVLMALDDENPRIRVGAIGAMRRLANEEDGPRLAAALLDSDANVRMVASSVLASVMTSGLREQTLMLLQHPSPDARAAAAQVLRQDAHPSSVEALRKAAAREPEPWVVELIEAAIETIRATS